MPGFNDILTASSEELVRIFYVFENETRKLADREKADTIARKLRLRTGQLLLAVGFNPDIYHLPELLPILGYKTIDDLYKDRNETFVKDIYKRVSLDNILNLYATVKEHPDIVQIMQYLIGNRLMSIESRIEETVNSMLIEKYKAEIRAIYLDGIAGIDFAENRLNKMDSGFRALVNEVSIITESKIIPAGEIFFRNTILPEEKRKLLNRGFIPLELVHSRLEDESISQREKKMLQDYLSMNKNNPEPC